MVTWFVELAWDDPVVSFNHVRFSSEQTQSKSGEMKEDFKNTKKKVGRFFSGTSQC